MTTDLRNQVDWLAGEGYLAAGPDLFHWGGKLRCIRTVMSEIRDGAGRSFDEVEAVRSWLTAHPRCNGKVGVIGYCMGGGFRSEEHTSELQSLMRISYAVFCLKKKKKNTTSIRSHIVSYKK